MFAAASTTVVVGCVHVGDLLCYFSMIFRSSEILIEIVALDLLSFALDWVSSEKEFRELAVAVARSSNVSTVLVWYAVYGARVLPQ